MRLKNHHQSTLLLDNSQSYKYIKVKKRKKTGKSFKEIITRSFDIEYYSKHKDESIMNQLYE